MEILLGVKKGLFTTLKNHSVYMLYTVFLSFLERERDRDFLNVLDRDLVQYDRFRPFTVPRKRS